MIISINIRDSEIINFSTLFLKELTSTLMLYRVDFYLPLLGISLNNKTFRGDLLITFKMC
jgi:hypothetical protein